MQTEPRLTPELYCSDIARTLAFYVDVLGFAVLYDRPEEGFAMLDYQGARLMLDQVAAADLQKRSWISAPLEYPWGRGMNLQIETDDVRALYDRVLAAGAPVSLPLEEKWYRADNGYVGNRQFNVLDPDGFMLRFFEDLGTVATPPQEDSPQ